MAFLDTLLGGALAIVGGIAGAGISQWLAGRQQSIAAQQDLEDQRRAALRTASARYSQFAVTSSNGTSDMISSYQKSSRSARVDRNPGLAAKLIGALGEVLLLTTSVDVADVASALRWQLKLAYQAAEKLIESHDAAAGATPVSPESVLPLLERAVELRSEFLNAVRKELGLGAVIRAELGLMKVVQLDAPSEALRLE